MKSLLTAVIVGIILFAISAGVSSYLILGPMAAKDEATEESDETVDDSPMAFPKPVGSANKMPEMPVSLRPETPVTVEAVTELAQSIMKKEKMLHEAQQMLKKEEKRINLLFSDLKQEREELDAFGKRIDAKIIQAKEAVELLKLENQTLQQQKNELATLERSTGTKSENVADVELTRRVDVVKSWFTNLDVEQSANYMKEFANRGDLQFAARLLDTLNDRKIAKILAEFNDPPLVAQIVDAYTESKKSVAEAKKNRVR